MSWQWASFLEPPSGQNDVAVTLCILALGVLQHVLSETAVRRPFDPEVVIDTECMITTYQNVYYFADSFIDAKNKLRSAVDSLPSIGLACTEQAVAS